MAAPAVTAACLLLLLALAQVSAEAPGFEAACRDGNPTGVSIAGELVQPLRW